MAQDDLVRVRNFQPLSIVREVLRVFDGTPKALIGKIWTDIQAYCDREGSGSDWSDPGAWISDRLPSDTAGLARRLWEESRHTVNPHYLYGPESVIDKYGLARLDEAGVYQITERGRRFLNGDQEVGYEIDEGEGLLAIAEMVASHGTATTSDILPQWEVYLQENSTMPPKSAYDALRRRIRDLIDRALVERVDGAYTVSVAGQKWRARYLV